MPEAITNCSVDYDNKAEACTDRAANGRRMKMKIPTSNNRQKKNMVVNQDAI